MAETSRITPSEEWRTVAGYEGLYEVSDRGRVRSTRGVRRLETHMRGYLTVQLYRYGVAQHHLVHRLVAIAFCERPEGADIVRHLDGSTSNNVPRNLAWGTLSDNNFDAVRHGTHRNSRKTHCKQGHLFDEENTGYSMSRGRPSRYCRACVQAMNDERGRLRRERREAAA